MSADQLTRVTSKLQELVKRYELLRKENAQLKSELLPAKEREIGFMDKIASLEEKILVLKAGSGNMSDADKKELDKKLHLYLKEIDRCINMLSE